MLSLEAMMASAEMAPKVDGKWLYLAVVRC